VSGTALSFNEIFKFVLPMPVSYRSMPVSDRQCFVVVDSEYGLRATASICAKYQLRVTSHARRKRQSHAAKFATIVQVTY